MIAGMTADETRAGPARRAEEARPSVEELIDAYGDGILRLCCLMLGDRQLAEDAFQVTVTRAWQQLPAFRGESGVKTWLTRIAVNACRDTQRSGWFRFRRRSVPLDALTDLPAAGNAAEDAPDVRGAVLSLPAKYREAVTLYYFEEMNTREIAELLQLPTATVTTRLSRARALLAKKLGEEVETHEG